ncbi:hypothetical protein [Pedobacter sp. KACC 23697]|uniref:Uncharacterized protein n=1 Tax=Pedobacter sp. KACC 23697 TaxID=3149230 RepID=A0AAU7K1W3_9SPHI
MAERDQMDRFPIYVANLFMITIEFECSLGFPEEFVEPFDGLYIKKDAAGNFQEVLIIEAKQVSVMGNIKLNAANPRTGLRAQMSDGWVRDVIAKLKADSNTSTLGNTLETLFQNNRNLFTKTVTGVDRSSGEIIMVKLAQY